MDKRRERGNFRPAFRRTEKRLDPTAELCKATRRSVGVRWGLLGLANILLSAGGQIRLKPLGGSKGKLQGRTNASGQESREGI